MNTKALDTLTKEATAFVSWDALKNALENNGYVPTLARKRPAQIELGEKLEELGYKVFWL